MRSLCSANGMNTLGGTHPRCGVLPTHECLEAHDVGGREVDDGLIVHGRFPACSA